MCGPWQCTERDEFFFFLAYLLVFPFFALLNTPVWLWLYSEILYLKSGWWPAALPFALRLWWRRSSGCCSLSPSLCWPASAPSGFSHKHHPYPGAPTVGSYWKFSKVFSLLCVEIPIQTENSGLVVTDLQNRIILHSVALLSKASWVFSFRNNFQKSMLWTNTFVVILFHLWGVYSNFQTIYQY